MKSPESSNATWRLRNVILAALGAAGLGIVLVNVDQSWTDQRKAVQPAIESARGSSCIMTEVRPLGVANVLHLIAAEIESQELAEVLSDKSLAGADFVASQAYQNTSYSFSKQVCEAAQQHPEILMSQGVNLRQA